MDSSLLFQDALGALETPGGRSMPGERVETPLTDVVNRNLKVALANSTRSKDAQEISASPQLVKKEEKQVTPNKILKRN